MTEIALPTEKRPSVFNLKAESSFLHSLSGLELIRLEHTLQRLKQKNGTEEIPLVKQPESKEFVVLGTDRFTTNTVLPEVLASFGEDEQTTEQIMMTLQSDNIKRYWGDSDVRGCAFIVLSDGNGKNAVLSALHFRFDSAESREDFERKFKTLISPFKDTSRLDIHLVGGFDENSSIDTLAALIHKLQKTFTSISFKTVDILNRADSAVARKPVFDTQEQKMYYIEPAESKEQTNS